jgi:hypothetical protein
MFFSLANSLKSLDGFCFCGCSSLSQINSPNSITSLGIGCSPLSKDDIMNAIRVLGINRISIS